MDGIPRALARRAICAAAGLLVLLLGGAGTAAALTPSNTPAGDWTLVGTSSGTRVQTILRHGSIAYVGGQFSGIAKRAVGLAGLDPGSGDVTAHRPELDPDPQKSTVTVSAVAAAPDGGLYVAGDFAGAGGVAQPRLLRFTPAGELDLGFRPVVDSGTTPGAAAIRDLEVDPADGTVYLAGDFLHVGGQNRAGVAAVDGATGAVRPLNPSPDGRVTDLALDGGTLYLAGTFAKLGQIARPKLAAVSLGTGAVTTWHPDIPSGVVNSLALQGDTMYLGGSFTTVDGQPRQRLAAVKATGTGELVAAFAPGAISGGDVAGVVATAGAVYLRGGFFTIDGKSRMAVGAVDPATGAVLDWNPGVSDRSVDALTVAGDRVYLGFAFAAQLPRVGGLPRCGVASVAADGAGAVTSWDPRLTVGVAVCDPNQSQPGTVGALMAAGGRIWAGGRIDIANALPRTGLAAIDATTGAPTSWAPTGLGSATDHVSALALSKDGSTLYLGGAFTTVNGVARRNAAAIATAGTAADATAIRRWDPAPDDEVLSLALSAGGGRVYLGGRFGHLGSLCACRRLAGVGASDGAPAPGWRPDPDGSVRALAVGADNRVWAAGSFAAIAGAARAGLAALAPDSGAPSAWDAGLGAGAVVDAVALDGARIVAGGDFTAPGGRANLAAFDAATAAPTAWRPAVDGPVLGLAVDPDDGTAYVAGDFHQAGGEDRDHAAAVATDGAATAWAPTFPGALGGAVTALALTPEGLLAGGAFTNADGRPRTGLGYYGRADAPVAVAPPSIVGAAHVGAQLECHAGAFGGGAGRSRWAWLRDGATIPEAASNTYTLIPDDRGHALRCRQTVVNTAGSATQDSDPVTVSGQAPALLAAPSVGGESWVGGTAACTTGLWANGPTSFAYRWRLDGALLPGETAARHVVSAGEQGHTLACEVTAANEAGSAPAAASAPVTITEAPPQSVSAPAIDGEPRVGAELTCGTGLWRGARTFAYAWLRGGVPVAGATAERYTATGDDLGHLLRCVVTAANAGGALAVPSPEVQVVAAPHSAGFRRPPPAVDLGTAAASRRPVAAVAVRSVRLTRGRLVTVRVATPAAGALALVARSGRAVLARGRRTARRAQTLTVRVVLPRASCRRLTRRAGVPVTFTATFDTTAGARTTDRETVTLRAAKEC